MLLIVITITFFSIPKFFDFEKKQNLIKEYLFDKYSLETTNINSINYQIFPAPHLILADVKFRIQNSSIESTTKNLKIYLNLKNIISLKDLTAKKVLLLDTNSRLKLKTIRTYLSI